MEAAGHVIALFRNGEAQPVKDWEHARAMLAEALSMDPDDTVRGELRAVRRARGPHHRDCTGTTERNW